MSDSIKVKCRSCEAETEVDKADWVGNASEAQRCIECTGESAYELAEYDFLANYGEDDPLTKKGNVFDD